VDIDVLTQKSMNISTNRRTLPGQFGRVTSIQQLPAAAEFTRLIHAAMKLKQIGVVTPARANAAKSRVEKRAREIPDALAAALKKNKKPRRRLTVSATQTKKNMSSGSARQKPSSRATSALRRRSGGWPRARPGTGITCVSEESAPQSLQPGALKNPIEMFVIEKLDR
jgi:hypothetical protein